MSDNRLHSCNTLTAGLDLLATNCGAEVQTTMDLDAMIAVLWLIYSLAPFKLFVLTILYNTTHTIQPVCSKASKAKITDLNAQLSSQPRGRSPPPIEPGLTGACVAFVVIYHVGDAYIMAGPPVIADASGSYAAGFAETQPDADDIPPAQRTRTPSIALKTKQESFYSQDAQPLHRCPSSRTLLESQTRRLGMLTSPKPSIAPASVHHECTSDVEDRSPSPPATRAGFEVPPPAQKQARDGLWWKHFN